MIFYKWTKFCVIAASICLGFGPAIGSSQTTTFISGPKVQESDQTYRVVTDPASGIAFVEFLNTKNEESRLKLNQMLETEGRDLIAMNETCKTLQGVRDETQGIKDYRLKIMYLTNSVLTFRQETKMNCGTVKNINYSGTKSYDLLIGSKIDFRNILNLYVSPDEVTYPIRPYTVRSPAYSFLIQHLSPISAYALPAARSKTSDGEDCFEPFKKIRHDLPKYTNYSLAFISEGMLMMVDTYNTSIPECSGDYFLIPYSDMGPLWRPIAKNYFPDIS